MDPRAGDRIDPSEVKRLSTIVSDRIAEMIRTGELRPGERLVQTKLAGRFGVSRVAIRDALIDLRGTGLTVNRPNEGDVVSPVSSRTVRDLFEIRELLESRAVESAVRAMGESSLRAIRIVIEHQEEAVRSGDVAAYLGLDWELHEAMYAQCPNKELVSIVGSLWSRTRQARSLAGTGDATGLRWARTSLARHRELVGALERRDATAAGEIMRHNIRTAGEELVARLEELGFGDDQPSGKSVS
ncbi:MAG: GntR family transcriptional regulator [Spirochaetota bacterium]